MWQKKGKGPKYIGHYVRDPQGERVMVLIGFKPNGEIHTVTGESWQMFKQLGWSKVS